MASPSGSTLKKLQDQGYTLENLLAFHNVDRKLYRRVRLQPGLVAYTSKQILAFWLFLERAAFRNFVNGGNAVPRRYGLRNFVSRANAVPDTLFAQLVGEAITCLDFLYRPEPKNSVGGLPSTCGFAVADGDDLESFISLNRDKCVKEIDEFMNDLGKTIFESIDGEFAAAEETPALSPSRSLFVTFSKGHPITREQLSEFFISKYGADCVEDIHMGSQPPSRLYANVILRSSSYVTAILGENEVVQFCVFGKDVRVKRFVSKSMEQQQTSSSSSLNQDSQTPS